MGEDAPAENNILSSGERALPESCKRQKDETLKVGCEKKGKKTGFHRPNAVLTKKTARSTGPNSWNHHGVEPAPQKP